MKSDCFFFSQNILEIIFSDKNVLFLQRF